MSISINEFLSLRNELPVVDVRSEGEFEKGNIPGAINIPLLNNAERIEVGTDYVQKGRLEAIRTGFRLVGPRLHNIISETEKISSGKEIIVHCWRGGMRSSNFCGFVGMARIKTHQLAGGYKSYRQAVLESFKKQFQFIVVGGCTGSGKSEILRALAQRGEQIIDLETLARHKGSSFGGLKLPPQPTTEQFQNNLFEKILKIDVSRRIWIEDESISIGKIFLPDDFWRTMCTSPVIEIQVDKPVRVSRLVNEYGDSDKEEFLKAMERITKRLGPEQFKAAKASLLQGNMYATIESLLTYYDKSYLRLLEKTKSRIVSRMQWDGENVNAFVNDLADEKILNHIGTERT